MRWNAEKPVLYSCSLDATLRVWDGRNGAPLQVLQGHTANIMDLALTGDGRAVTCGEDRQAFVFQLHQ